MNATIENRGNIPRKTMLCMLGLMILLQPVFCDGDSLIRKNRVSFTTLVVDYNSYKFEGGNLAWYLCPDCPNEFLPLTVCYKPPSDFGDISFRLNPTNEQVFHATLIWMGTGAIQYPKGFSTQDPFEGDGKAVPIPEKIHYTDASRFHQLTSSFPACRELAVLDTKDTSFIRRANGAWHAIDSLAITRAYACYPFEASIYLYLPTAGPTDYRVAKWIIFLYYNDVATSAAINPPLEKQLPYPNPAENSINIPLENKNRHAERYCLSDLCMKTLKLGLLSPGKGELNISDLAKGIYILTLYDRKGSYLYSVKIMKW